MPDTSSERFVLLNRLADEFAARYRSGERPPLQEYIDRHPELADDIRELFPALVEMEQVKEDRQAPAGQSASLALLPLERLGDYRIVREIGHGGMGVVYEAEQVSLGRHVALKVLSQQRLADEHSKRRFEREAKAAARLHHTNIVPVFGVGEHEGMPYYVMQFIQGLGLDLVLEELRRLRQAGQGTSSPKERNASAAEAAQSLLSGRFAPPSVDGTVDHLSGEPEALASGWDRQPEANASGSPGQAEASSVVLPGSQKQASYWQSVARIGVQVADALAHAHGQGILHRDVKPANLLLDAAGAIWVADFGLAKADDQQNLTHTGDILGTLRYMPPEAFDGRADARGDVYSLGLTLYEMLAFRPAFDEKERNKLVKQVTLAEPPPLRRLNPDVPGDLVTIVHKAIEREPDRRYATAEELAADLGRFLDDEPIHARRISLRERAWRWCRRNPAGAGLAVVSGLASLALVGLVVGLSFYTRLKKAHKDEAEQRVKVEQYQYYHRLARAAAAWREGSLAGVEELLDACPAEQRHWEWRFLKRQCHTDLLTVAHGSAIPDGAHVTSFSPDGKWFLTVGRTVDIRDAATGVVERSLPGDGVAAFSPDGRWVASSNLEAKEGSEKTVRLWDLASEKEIHRFRGHTDNIQCLVFSPDGKRLAASGYGEGLITVWDTATGQKSLSIRNPPDPARPRPPDEGAVYKAAFSPDGTRLALACRDSTVKICSATTGQVERTLHGHTWEVWGVAFSPDGKRLASASLDRTVKLWDVQTGQEVRTLRDHASMVWGVAYSPDGKWLASASLDGTVRLWDAANGRPLRTYKGHTRGVADVVFSPDSRRLASTSSDGTVKVWDATSDPEATGFQVHTTVVRKLAYSPDGARLASASHDGTLKVWDATTGRVIHTLKGPAGLALSVAFSPDGARLASGHSDGTARVWDAATGREERRLQMEPGSWVFVSLSSDGRRLAAWGWKDPKVKVWDVATGRLIFELEGHGEERSPALAFSPDGSHLVTTAADGITMKVWDATTGAWLRDLAGHTWNVRDVAFSGDGTRLATASLDRTVRVWNLATGEEVWKREGHTFFVESVAFTPDGKRLASVSREGTVKLWDTATGEEVFALRADTDEFPQLAFSPDGHQLAVSCGDGTVKIWDARPLATR